MVNVTFLISLFDFLLIWYHFYKNIEITRASHSYTSSIDYSLPPFSPALSTTVFSTSEIKPFFSKAVHSTSQKTSRYQRIRPILSTVSNDNDNSDFPQIPTVS